MSSYNQCYEQRKGAILLTSNIRFIFTTKHIYNSKRADDLCKERINTHLFRLQFSLPSKVIKILLGL